MYTTHFTNAPAIPLEITIRWKTTSRSFLNRGIDGSSSKAMLGMRDPLMGRAKVSPTGMRLMMMRMTNVQQRNPSSTSIASIEDRGYQQKEKLARLSKGKDLRLL